MLTPMHKHDHLDDGKRGMQQTRYCVEANGHLQSDAPEMGICAPGSGNKALRRCMSSYGNASPGSVGRGSSGSDDTSLGSTGAVFLQGKGVSAPVMQVRKRTVQECCHLKAKIAERRQD